MTEEPTKLENTEAESANTDDAAEGQQQEGDLVADYIEELLDITDLDGDIDIEERAGRTYVSVLADDNDEELQALVGRHGKVLNALQDLSRLMVHSETGERSRVILDVAGYREQRAQELAEIGYEGVEKVKAGETEVHLKPMGSYERKIVHDAVAEVGFHTASEGEGAQRHVVISAGE